MDELTGLSERGLGELGCGSGLGQLTPNNFATSAPDNSASDTLNNPNPGPILRGRMASAFDGSRCPVSYHSFGARACIAGDGKLDCILQVTKVQVTRS